MRYRCLADAVLLLHLGFILFVIAGALLVARRPRLLPWHLAAAAWGVGIEAVGAVCPLTWLENRLRALAGQSGYGGGFIEHYVAAAIYPAGLTRPVQVALGVAVLLLNAGLYARLWRGRSTPRARPEPPPRLPI
ncbi:DUF2784 domain-containing protein [Massilia sp. 9096]|uniref:DUF2784 domain-containing protein n=1 Tax=Massilia sp. 9096 TaxID=1500894 RepID=UPI00055EF7F1|nr:DUF2784 domain-containing protein [Massilia sp. 9096]